MNPAEAIQDVRVSITELPAPGTLTRRGFMIGAAGALAYLAGCGRNQESPDQATINPMQPISCPNESEFKTPLAKGAKYFRGNPDDPFYIGVKDMLESGDNPDIECHLERLQQVPVGDWVGGWTKDVTAYVHENVQVAKEEGKMPILVGYNIPKRDASGGYSEGGAGNEEEYMSWVREFAEGIGDAPAVVVWEPDALLQSPDLSPDDAKARIRMLSNALKIFQKNCPNAKVFLDAGNSGWRPVKEVADLLRLVDDGSGVVTKIALNVANFGSNEQEAEFGEDVSRDLGRELDLLVDGSRNGAHVEHRDKPWNNPEARVGNIALSSYVVGARVTIVHVKQAGRSDGNKHNPEQAKDGDFDSRLLRQQLGVGDPNSPYA